MKFFVKWLFFCATLFNINAIEAATNTAIKNAWTELGSNGRVIARVITDASCPKLVVNQSQTILMSLRVGKSKKFPVNVCERVLPNEVKTVTLHRQTLRLPILPKKIQRIVIIGDTGCRLKGMGHIQACNNPKKWTFARIAMQAAKARPDLVIHVGDYYYRELACPLKNKSCMGSPFGDDWSSWQADFFLPAKPLLAAAPWVFVRGNHEDCERGGSAWMRFLEPFQYSKECHMYSPLYFVPIGNNTDLAVLDSSVASDFSAPKDQVELYAEDFAEIKQHRAKNIWLLTHKPIWVLADEEKTLHAFSTLQKAIENNLPANLRLIISGHIHLFAALSFENKPAQIINGNSGTELETGLIGAIQKSLFVSHYKTLAMSQFGYLVLEKKAEGWYAEEHNMNGKVTATCELKQQQHFICSVVK